MIPYAIYDSLWGIEYYREVLQSLRAAGGYTFGDIDAPKPGDNAFVFLYDWRRDNVHSAALLARTIDRLAEHFGDPGQKFDLVAHSQGGLVARYYVKYGDAPLPPEGQPPRPTMAGARHAGKVVMLGTPNRGCLEALKILHVGLKKVFRPIRPEVVFTMPSVYQMLPPPDAIHFAGADGEPIALDIYDASAWERAELSIFSKEAQERVRERIEKTVDGGPAALNDAQRAFLARMLSGARRFQEALDAPAAGEASISYHAFGSDCDPTLKAVVILDKGKGRRDFVFDDALLSPGLRDKLAKVFYGAGDGKVLMSSLLAIPDGPSSATPPETGTMEFDTAFFVCDDHGVLPNNPIFQHNLLYLLLRDDAGAPALPAQAAGG